LRFDLAMDLEFFSRASAILTELVGARSTCGFYRFTMEGLYRGDFLSHKIQYNPHIHTALSFYSMIEGLLEPENTIPLPKKALPELLSLPLAKMKFDEKQKAELWEILKYENPSFRAENQLIIINANSSELVPLRRWPLSSFIELGKKLIVKYPGAFIVLTGVKSEVQESLAVAESIGSEKVINLVGKTSLKQLLVLYSLCKLMITNDSGPSHFSSLTDLPVVTLFGPETSKLYGAFGKNRMSISANLACSPCVSSYNHRSTPCNDNVCMKQISVEEVFGACIDLLEKQGEF
jgi:ADP-heptose:LPS heptosyltransferase